MKIEEEIKQSKFNNEYAKLLVNILFTGNWVYHSNKKFLKEYDLSPEQYNVLRILRGQYPNPSTVNLLNERMLDKMSNVSRLVEKLRLKQLVERSESSEDRRQVDILITKKGLRLLNKIDTNLVILEDQLKSLEEDEAATLNALLDKLRS